MYSSNITSRPFLFNIRILNSLNFLFFLFSFNYKMGFDATKSVLDKASLKPVSAATDTSKKSDISPVASLDMILSKKRILKALISLCIRTDWSAALMLANPEDRFSQIDAQIIRPFFTIIKPNPDTRKF